jgi:hypothetical protein
MLVGHGSLSATFVDNVCDVVMGGVMHNANGNRC